MSKLAGLKKPVVVSMVAIVALTIFLWPPARNFLFVNEAITAVCANHILMGDKLYRDVRDWTPPVGNLIYAAALRVTNGSVAGIHLVGLLSILTAIVCAGWTAYLFSGWTAALIASLLTMVALTRTVGPSTEMEVFMVPLSAAGYLCVALYFTGERRRWLPVLAGFFFVMAISTKQPALLDLAVLAVSLLLLTRRGDFGRRARTAFTPGLLGVIIGCVALAGLIARYSTFKDYIAWTWLIPSVVKSTTVVGRLHQLVAVITRGAGKYGPLWPLAFATAIYYGLAFWREPKPRSHKGAFTPAFAGLVLPLWLFGAIAATTVGGAHAFHHYAQAAVPTGVLAGVGVAATMHALKHTNHRRWAYVILIAAVMIGLAGPARTAAWQWRDRVLRSPEQAKGHVGDAYQAGRMMAQLTAKDQYVQSIGKSPEVLFWSGRPSASRFIYGFAALNETMWLRRGVTGLGGRMGQFLGPLTTPTKLFYREFQKHRPTCIVTHIQPGTVLSKLLKKPANRTTLNDLLAPYEKIGVFGDYTVYTLSSDGAPNTGAKQ